MIPGQGAKSLHTTWSWHLVQPKKREKLPTYKLPFVYAYRCAYASAHTKARLYFSGYKIRYAHCALGCLMKTELTGLADGPEVEDKENGRIRNDAETSDLSM